MNGFQKMGNMMMQSTWQYFSKRKRNQIQKNHEAIEKLQNSVRSVENKLDLFITASSSDNTKFV